MDILALLEMGNGCITGEAPPCSCACPLGVDVHALAGKMRAGSYAAAYKAYAKAVVFPEIVSRVCDEPCRAKCVRAGSDEAINLRALERAACRFAKNKSQSSYFIPPKKHAILVVGAGLSGLTCAIKLAQRGYSVTLAEASNRLGGRLWERDDLPGDVIEAELGAATRQENLTVRMNEPVESLEGFKFDTAYIATGVGGADLGLRGAAGIFFSRSDDGARTPPESIARGAMVTYAMENYLKTGTMSDPEPEIKQCAMTYDKPIEPAFPPAAESAEDWTEEDAKSEAARCLLCKCTSCMDGCEMLKYFRKLPKKVIIDICETSDKDYMTTKIGLRQLGSCMQCGLCDAACPVGVDVGKVCLESRRSMHRDGSLPETFYEYWIEDMDFSNSEEAALLYSPTENPKYLYFPGCQMPASDPEYVTKSYSWLLGAFPDDAALMLGCCGAPASWAGREDERREVMDGISAKWQSLGKPTAVLACPTCVKMFREFLPEIPVVTLWELMAERGGFDKLENTGTASVFDSCSSRYSPKMRGSVRGLAGSMGFALEELPSHGELAKCCGYGGLVFSVTPEIVDGVREQNAAMSDNDYITFCVNCRDSFASVGKNSFHILDALFFEDYRERGMRPAPSLSERRDNRHRAKRIMEGKTGNGGESAAREPYMDLKIVVSPELTAKMDRALVYEENIKRTLWYAEETGYSVYDPRTECYTAHMLQGILTYWVVYKKTEDGIFEISNVYRHRMVIEERTGQNG